MSAHLTDAELRAFAAARLSAEDLMRADDHLSACEDCRARGSALNDLGRISARTQSRLTTSDVHLTEEEIQSVVRGPLAASQGQALERHLRECETCSDQVADLRAWSGRSERRIRPLAIAAGLLLAVLIPAAVWTARTPRRQAPAVAGLAQLDPSGQQQVRAALDAGVARLPDFVAGLAGSRETLMGTSPPAAGPFAPTSPVATATVGDRPQFRWQPLAGADAYVVTVFDEQSNEVARSAPLDQPAWTPDRPLPRERTYVWQIAAHRNGQTIVAPAAPMPPAKFHVVDAHTADAIERAQSQPASHLVLGILDMNAGVVDDAIRHFEQVGPADQGADLARRSLARLRAVRGS